MGVEGGSIARVPDKHNLCYQGSTVPVKEKLEVIEGEEDRKAEVGRYRRDPSARDARSG